MSAKHLALVRQGYEAFGRRDLDGLVGLMDTAVVMTPLPPDDAPFHGHEGVRTWWRELFSVFGDFIADVDEVRDCGDVMLVAARVRGHGIGRTCRSRRRCGRSWSFATRR